MCNGRSRETPFHKIFHTALLVGLVSMGGIGVIVIVMIDLRPYLV